MVGIETPNDNEVDDILAKMGDPSLQPVYVHCTEGVDRTGLIIALYRVIEQGWAPKDAHDEMMAHGFKSLIDRDEQLLREEDQLGRLDGD